MDAVISSRASLSGDAIKHVAAGNLAVFDITSQGVSREDIDVSIIGPGKQQLAYRINDKPSGYAVEFETADVGNYVVDVNVSGVKAFGSPFITRVYNSSLIRVSDVPSGIVGQPCQFKVDASNAGEGQLEISINEGEVPNHVQVLGGGRCLVSFTPEQVKVHSIDIKFNAETVPGCPYLCRVTDTSLVGVNLRHLELIPISEAAAFTIHVDASTNAELAVSVRGPGHTALPVKVTGSPRGGFRSEFVPREVGTHTISVEYNGSAVAGTPFTSKVYDQRKVYVSPMPRGNIGKPTQFTVDASQAGEGNLEITISAKGRNIPTQVHPQGNARFTVSFVPLEAIDHVISISFNKEAVPGSPFVAPVFADPNRIVVSGQSLASAAVGKSSYFTMNNVQGSVEDIEVNIEGPTSVSVPAQVVEAGEQTFKVEFNPKIAGEHRIHVFYSSDPVPGSPFTCKVYDVNQIKVRETLKGVVGKPVTFLVETSEAGPGNLEVTVNAGQVPTSAQSQGNHTYAIAFTPKEPKTHIVELKFNNENVPGSPFRCHVMDASQVLVTGEGLEKVSANQPAVFYISTQENMSDLDVKILSPNRRMLPASMKTVSDRKYQVEYLPTEIGDHYIEVRYADLHVPGSPFLTKAYDATKINVTDIKNGQVGKPVYFSIDASAAGAGNLEIIVSVNGKHVPNYVQPEGNAKFRVNFKPTEAATHTLSVKFNGEPVPGSAFNCCISDYSQICVSEDALKMAALSSPVKFSVDARGADISLCTVRVVSPTANNVPVAVTEDPPGTISSEFHSTEVGPHTVSVLFDGDHVAGSPYTCNIYDVNKVKITGIRSTKVSVPVTFTVDASQAGEGTLELVVTTRNQTVRAEVTARARGLYDITFTPQEPVPHLVNITFNEQDVAGSPFSCSVRELDSRELREIKRTESKLITARGDGLKESVVGAGASFVVDCKGRDGDIDVRITGPSDSLVPVRVTPMRNGIHRVDYSTDEIGVYRVEVFYASQLIAQPYLVEVADPNKVNIFDVQESFTGKDASFKVDASNAGRGTLNVVVRKPGGLEVKHSLRDLGWGIYQVIFTPTVTVPHKVSVKYAEVNIKGSPLEISVKNPLSGKTLTATGMGLYQSRVAKTTNFVIETLGNHGKDFDVFVTGPGDSAIPVKCYQQRDENLLAEFLPQTSGAYKIDVLYNGKSLQGSPYMCEVYDPSRVIIHDLRSSSFVLNQKIVFTVEHGGAGQAELDVSVLNPQGSPSAVTTRPLADGSSTVVEFNPTSPGKYKAIITYGEDEVPGSPVNVMVEEEGSAQIHGDGLLTGLVGKPGKFTVDPMGLAGEPTVQVDGPDSVAKCTLEQFEDGKYSVVYTPQEVGVFDIRVLWNGQEVAGSPFHPRILDPSKIRAIGGWDAMLDEEGRIELTVNEEKKVNFDVSEAGPAKLKVELQGPKESVACALEQTTTSRYKLQFTPPHSGEYLLYIQWGDINIPGSPFTGYANPLSSPTDHTRVLLRGHGLTQAKINEDAEFIIDGSEAGPGSPEVNMSGMQTDIKVTLQPEGNNVFKAIYKPTTAGSYLLNVMWSGRQVKRCPLKVSVSTSTNSTKVMCSGDGLKGGTVGRDIRSFIDTRRAGPGELTAHCVGPHKTAYCELYDHSDGTFTLNIKPQEPGRHNLTIKYGGEHVPGSPYTLRIAGPPDASKVRVYGPGIEPGVLAAFQSRFLCDTRGAGAGQLTVRLRGPKGAFRVEMQRQSQKDRTILCKYSPTEPGDYRIEVKWSGTHVPGSPFAIMIFDTQEELNRYVQGGYSPQINSGGGGGPGSEYYGSIGGGGGTYSTTYGQVSLGQTSWRGSQAQL